MTVKWIPLSLCGTWRRGGGEFQMCVCVYVRMYIAFRMNYSYISWDAAVTTGGEARKMQTWNKTTPESRRAA
jgi:hypothetical protein